MKSSNPYLPVPATVTVSKYYSSVYVQLTPKAYAGGKYNSTVSVHYGSTTLSQPITVYPGLSADRATSSNNGYDSVDFAIQLTGKGPMQADIASSKQLGLPTHFTVPADATAGGLST